MTHPPGTRAVLYVCTVSPKGAEDARLEGLTLATARGFRLIDSFSDQYGDTEPANRPGWQQLSRLIDTHTATLIITRWPVCISRDETIRHQTLNTLAEHGARVLYSWPIQEPSHPAGRR